MATVINYTEAQTDKMVSDYKAGMNVETIASSMGKTVRSVIAKLSREGVYKAKVRTNKTGGEIIKKDTLVDALQMQFGLTDAEADSLTKANKTALVKVLTKFIEASAATMSVTDLTEDHD